MVDETPILLDLDAASHLIAKQDLKNAEKFQPKGETNLDGAVRYDGVQVLTEQQKAQARANIGAGTGDGSGSGSAEGAVQYNVEQALTDEQKSQARTNIGTTDGTWAAMPDKPFGEVGFGCDWNGNTADLEKISVVEDVVLYKVADHNLTKEEIKSKILGAECNFHWESNDIVETITEAMMSEGTNGSVLVLLNSEFPIVLVTAESGTETIIGMEIEIPSAGIWFLRMSDTEYVKYLHKDYSIKKIEEKYLPDDIGTWAAMPDKPFGETGGWSIEWDGTPTSDFVDVFEGVRFYKVSDKIPSKEELVGAKYVGVDGESKPLELTLSSSDIDDYGEACYGLANEPCFIITTQPTEVSIGDLILPVLSSGTWFIGLGERVSLSNSGIKKIDKKFLPDDIKVELPEGLVTTDENGLIPAALLPSYVDDVVEGVMVLRSVNDNTWDFLINEQPITPESGKIYVDLNTGNTYRWSGSMYVRLNPTEYKIATTSDIDALFA